MRIRPPVCFSLRLEKSAYEATKSRKRSSLFYQMADSLTQAGAHVRALKQRGKLEARSPHSDGSNQSRLRPRSLAQQFLRNLSTVLRQLLQHFLVQPNIH